jgi:PhnB protein
LISLLAAKLALSAWGLLAGTLCFSKRSIMNGPDGKPIHAELTLRGTTLMLGPENPALGKRGAKTVGASPAGRFLYVASVDKIVAKAVSLGATAQGQVMDMFWGDHCGAVATQRDARGW